MPGKKKPMLAQREHANSRQKGQNQYWNLKPSVCEATALSPHECAVCSPKVDGNKSHQELLKKQIVNLWLSRCHHQTAIIRIRDDSMTDNAPH